MIDIDEQGRSSAWLERAWLARYLERELTEQEAARFEAYVLDKPDLLREIEADTMVRDAIASAGSQVRQGLPSATSVASAETRRRGRQWLPLAASLVIGIGAGAMWRLIGTATEDDTVQASPTRVVFDSLRGEATKPRWEQAKGGSRDVIVDVAVAPDATKITATLPDGRAVELHASADGFATFIAPRALMAGKKVVLIMQTADGRLLERTLEFTEGD